MTHRFNMALLLLLIAIGLPFYWLLMDNRPGDPEPKTVTMAQLRRIAATGPGPEPVAIQFEQIAATPHMRNRLTAGRGIRYDWQPFHAFRVDYGDLPPVLIETGMTRRQAQDMQFARYDDEAARRIASEIERARAVILLGRGVYHGGLLVPDIPAGQAVPDPNEGKTLPFSPAKALPCLPQTTCAIAHGSPSCGSPTGANTSSPEPPRAPAKAGTRCARRRGSIPTSSARRTAKKPTAGSPRSAN
ncbi:MAG: hypothetical protein R3D89_05755 [Sphingomonadaceae bacterium]